MNFGAMNIHHRRRVEETMMTGFDAEIYSLRKKH